MNIINKLITNFEKLNRVTKFVFFLVIMSSVYLLETNIKTISTLEGLLDDIKIGGRRKKPVSVDIDTESKTFKVRKEVNIGEGELSFSSPMIVPP